MSVTDSTASPSPTPKKKMPRVAKLILAGGAFFGVVTASAIIAASLPTNVARLSAAHPAIEDRSHRKPGGERCALSEVGTAGACKKAVVTSVREEQVSFASRIPEKGLARLKGTLTIPVGLDGPRPAIIMIHGSGPNGRDEIVRGDLVSKLSAPFKLFAVLADFFAHEGLVVLRYDKRVPQFYPELDRKKANLYRWSDIEMDARDALEFLATRPEVDGNRLIVAGHSEGGQIAPYVAHENARVAAVIMLAGPLENLEDGLENQLERLAVARSDQWDFLGAWSTRSAAKKYQPCFDKLRDPNRYNPEEMCLGGGVTQAALKDYNEYVARMPSILASDSSVVMALQGSVDRNIDPDAIPKIGQALGARDYELHYVPGVSHDLVNVVSPATPEAVDADVLRRLSAFLASVRR